MIVKSLNFFRIKLDTNLIILLSIILEHSYLSGMLEVDYKLYLIDR